MTYNKFSQPTSSEPKPVQFPALIKMGVLASFIYASNIPASTTVIEQQPQDISAFRISMKASPRQPRQGNLRLTNHVARGQLEGSDQAYYAWRGDWEYYVYERFTMNGVLQIPFNRAHKIRNNYMGLGFTGHLLRFGDLGMIAGASGGLNLVSHSSKSNALELAANLETGIIWQGDHFLFGTYYHLMFTVGYFISGFETRSGTIDLNHLVYSLGFGSTI